MKRWIVWLLALAMLLGAAAFAEEAEVAGRIDFTEELAPYSGKWVTFDDGFRLYLPSQWSRMNVSEAQAQAGLFYSEGNGGGDALVGDVAMGVAVGYAAAGDLKTLDDLARDYGSVGFTEVTKLDLNGMLSVTFVDRTNDYRGVAFFHPSVPGYVMSVYVSPCGETEQLVNDVGSAILCSLTPRGAKE